MNVRCIKGFKHRIVQNAFPTSSSCLKKGYADSFKFGEKTHLFFGVTRTNMWLYRFVPFILYRAKNIFLF